MTMHRLSDGSRIEDWQPAGVRDDALLRPLEPPPPTEDEIRHAQVLEAFDALTAGVGAVLDALSAPPPVAPEVHVAAPDLTMLETYLAGVAAAPSAVEVAELVAARVPSAAEQIAPAFDAVLKELKALGKKMSALSIMPSGGSTGHVIIDSGIITSITQPVTLTGTVSTVSPASEQRLDYDVRVDGNPVYVGTADPGTATSAAAWTVVKLTMDASARLTRKQTIASAIWDDRASLAW